ncbi:hypothetical protein Ancab_033074 [Ancistrocladus abbreviatus]
MQRWCFKLRSLSLLSTTRSSLSLPQTTRLFNYHSPIHHSSKFSAIASNFKTLFTSLPLAALGRHDFTCPPFPSSCNAQMRHFSAKSKEKKWKKLTPATSKVKKIKMKTYSSFKGRFRTMNDGNIRRWREGKRHNAHLKSKNAKRRLRRPAIVPLAYAKVMKKLNFSSNM